MTTGIRPIIDAAVGAALAEHPKYFTDKGHEHARTAIVRKIMAALRGDGGDKSSDAAGDAAHAVPLPMTAEPASREARAFIMLRQIAGASPPLRAADGKVCINAEAACPAVFALADAPLQGQWPFLTHHRNVAAWAEFFRETLPHAARRPIQQNRDDQTGILMPWPWPPAKDGKVYDTAEAAQ